MMEIKIISLKENVSSSNLLDWKNGVILEENIIDEDGNENCLVSSYIDGNLVRFYEYTNNLKNIEL